MKDSSQHARVYTYYAANDRTADGSECLVTQTKHHDGKRMGKHIAAE